MSKSSTPASDASAAHENSRRRRWGLAVLASLLLPGAGHFVLGANRRGAAWLGGFVLLSLVVPFSLWLFYLWSFGLRIACAGDAWHCAHREGSPPSVALAIASVAGVLVLGVVHTTLLRSFVVEAFKIPASSMEPTLHIGDHIMASKYDLAPAPGDVAVFAYPCDPGTDFVKRIVAIEGDRVEVRCGQLYVNDVAVEREAMADPCSYWDSDLGRWSERGCSRYRETLSGRSYEVLENPVRDDMAASAHEEDPWGFPDVSVPSCANSIDGLGRQPTEVLGNIIEHDPAPADSCARTRAYHVPDGHFFVMGDNRPNSSDSRIWGPVPNKALRAKAVYVWWSRWSPSTGASRVGRSLR